MVEGGHGRSIADSETLLAKLYFEGPSYILLSVTGPLSLCESLLQTQPSNGVLPNNYLPHLPALALVMYVHVCLYRGVRWGCLQGEDLRSKQ